MRETDTRTELLMRVANAERADFLPDEVVMPENVMRDER